MNTSTDATKDAERGVLGSMLLDSRARDVALQVLHADDFRNQEHARAFELISELSKKGDVDHVVFQAELLRREFPDAKRFVGELLEWANPGMLGRYCEIVRDGAVQKAIAAAGAELVAAGGASAPNRHGTDVLAGAEETLAEVRKRYDSERYILTPLDPHDYRDGYRRPRSLLDLDTTENPNRLLGNDWLCRGGGAILAAWSGKGKSVLAVQAGILWACGLDLWGLGPPKPLRIALVQSENDGQDMARTIKGVVNGLQIQGAAGMLEANFFPFWERTHSGDDFIARLRALVTELRPDIVIIDPVLSYLGGNASDQEVVGKFLREGLNGVAAITGCAWLLVHHASKPPKDPIIRDKMYEIADYLDLGSSEWANWPRAKLFLRELDAEARRYVLLAGKRGHAACFVDYATQPTRTVYIRHSTSGHIVWERDEQPESADAMATVEASKGMEELRRMAGAGEIGPTGSVENVKRWCAQALGHRFHKENFAPSRSGRPERQLYVLAELAIQPTNGRWDMRRLTVDKGLTNG